MYDDSTISHFWNKVLRLGDDDCWNWRSSTSRGYGRFMLSGKRIYAHRFAWQITNGPIPDNLDVLHRCDNPRCCNPSHLFPGTQADNNRDKMQKGRHVALSGDKHYSRIHPERLARGPRNGMNTHPEKRSRGEKNGNSKLLDRDIEEIRRMDSEGVHKTIIATRFGINLSTVYRIVNRELRG